MLHTCKLIIHFTEVINFYLDCYVFFFFFVHVNEFNNINRLLTLK